MSAPLLSVEERDQSDVSRVASPPTMNCIFKNGSGLKERNYMGLSDCSSVDSSAVSSLSEEKENNLNLKATELRLGLPGSPSPDRKPEFCMLNTGKLDEKPLFPLLPSKEGICPSSQRNVVLGNKRGFSDTMDDFSDTMDGFSETMDGFSEEKSLVYTAGNWMFRPGSDSESPQSGGQGKVPGNSGGAPSPMMKELPTKVLQERSCAPGGTSHNKNTAFNSNSAPASKAQVVGWPPIRSFRKNSLATTSKNSDEVDGKPCPGAFFVKVSMDGAPYLRKVDLRTYSTYQELSSALEKMFSCFTIGQCGSQGASGREMLSENTLRDLLHGSEYVLTYEDKEGDWMLVGDVPWAMFIDSCKRLKIMKGSDAIGLAPRALEKSRIETS